MSQPLPLPLPLPLRLRQVCLAAPHLAPVVDDLQAILGLQVCHRDPGLIAYGLENALLPVGHDFIEVVAPVQADTAAGRFIHRSRGHGGYMAIFQALDAQGPKAGQARAAALGVRTAHLIDRPAYQSVQLHPRDCRAAFIELGHSPGGDDRQHGTWWPAGPHWQAGVHTAVTQRLVGIVLESPEPAALLAHWARILGLPEGTPVLDVDGSTIRAEHGPADALGAMVLAVADIGAVLDRAVDRGYRVLDNSFHMAGVNIRLQHAH